ncbi:MAG: glycosyltransferase family 39 protein, partial [Pigmentiphaga sp.]
MFTENKPNWLWMLGALLGVRLLLMAFLPLIDTSEPRYAEIARLMAETGDWITPWFEPGVPFWGKPPLAFWTSALSFRLLGYHDFAARLPSWLASVATLILIYHYALHHYSRSTARLAVLIYASCLLPFVSTGAVLTDAYLTLALTLSLVSFGRLMDADSPTLWKLFFFLGLGLGLLAKGPLALVLALGVILPWCVWHRASRPLLRRIPWVSGILLCLTLALPWYGLAEWKTPGFLNYFLLGEHVYRFVDPGWQGDLYGSAHQRAYGSIWLDGLLATLPWGLIALWQGVRRCKPSSKNGEQQGRQPAKLDPRLSYLLLWMLVTPLLFTLSGNILWTYVQPSLPAFALLLAASLTNNPPRQLNPSRLLAPAALVPLAGLALCGWLILHPEQLKTEKTLIAQYQRYARPGQPLCYLGLRPFSARYYSRGQAALYQGKTPASLLEHYPAGLYLAVPTEQLPSLAGLTLSPVLFKNRRYALVFARPDPLRLPLH